MSFDPYHRWLGIPPAEQPPHHYRLLGLALFEESPDVIEAGADRQMEHLHKCQVGEHADLSRMLLNEVAVARICLLDPTKKAEYDRLLRERLVGVASDSPQGGKPDASPPPSPLPAPAPAPSPPLFGHSARAPAAAARAARRAKHVQLWACLGIVGLGIAAVCFIVVRAGVLSSRPAQPKTAAPVAQADRPKPPPPPPSPPKPGPRPAAPSPAPPEEPRAAEAPPWAKDPDAPPPAVAPFDAAKAREHQQAWAKYLKAPAIGTNSIGMKFALVPPGEFQMGSTPEEVARLHEEGKRAGDYAWYLDAVLTEAPRHRVRITRPFYLGLCQVTQAEYQRVMGTNPSRFHGNPDHPVEKVSWNDGVEFCRRLGEISEEKAAGAVYRLPTEAEWEYACRAGTETRFSFGDDGAKLSDHAWWNGNSRGSTRPVAQLTPNPWNLFDMEGSLWEWCADWYSTDYYGKSPVDDPPGPGSGTTRATRGGAWNNAHRGNFRCACRSGRGQGSRFDTSGFRVVRLVAPGAAGLQPVPLPPGATVYLPNPAPDPAFGDWLQDFEAALKKAAEEKKDVLVAFDGSDWCDWSVLLAGEVLLKREFRQKADKDFVLVFIDFPKKPEATARVQDAARNKKLAKHFEVEGYPTFVLADAQGRPFGVEGYVPGGVDAFTGRLSRWRQVKAARDEAFARVDAAQGTEKLKAVLKAVAVLEGMDRELGGMGLTRFYEPVLAEWVDAAEKADPGNAAGDLEVVFSALWTARMEAARRAAGEKPLDELLARLDEWTKTFKFKDPDRAVTHYLRMAQVLVLAGRSADAGRLIEEAAKYKPTDPALVWLLDRAKRSMTEGFAYGHGTGFVVAAGGYVLTNHHVIDGPGKLLVQLSPDPKDRVPAEVVAKDEKRDMALLKIDVPDGRGLAPLPISGAEVRRGMRIGAFGYGGAGDVGAGIKLTQGIVSSLPDKSTEQMIVLDCRVNPGNSGGPLCDTRGNVIGMVTAKSLSSMEFDSYGMALPADDLKKFVARHLPKDRSPPEARPSEKTLDWDEIDRAVSGSVLKVVKGM